MSATTVRKTLVGRSLTARRAGGPEKIRRLDKFHRAKISAEIARELPSKRRAEKKCAIIALSERLQYSITGMQPDEIIWQHELTRADVREAEKMAILNNMKAGNLSYADELAHAIDLSEEKIIELAKKTLDYHIKREELPHALDLMGHYNLMPADLTSEERGSLRNLAKDAS